MRKDVNDQLRNERKTSDGGGAQKQVLDRNLGMATKGGKEKTKQAMGERNYTEILSTGDH